MLISSIFLIVGFTLLIMGADYLVKGASAIAKKFKVPDLVIGLTIVSIGTSAPELSVNIIAGIDNSSGLALGNVLGSNLFNFLIVIGVAALIRPISLQKKTVKLEIPFTVIVSAILIVLMGGFIPTFSPGKVDRIDGFILITFFAIFLGYILYSSKKSANPELEIDEIPQKEYSFAISSLFIIGGLGALIWGGDIIVDHATKIAVKFGMSDTLIGLTIVALGTSLPELATSAVAAFRGKSDIAIGNVIGSNIFNILLVLGATSLIIPLPINNENIIDAYIALASTIVVVIFSLTGKKHYISRIEGALLILLYFVYMWYIFYR